MPKQPSFFQHDAFKAYSRTEHGGDLRKGRRKLWRPFDPRRPLHLTLRSERARGAWSMLDHKHERRIKHLVFRFAEKNGVKVYKYANSGNHLHLLVHAKRHEGFGAFLKTVTGLIARAVTGARKGKPAGRFWDSLAWSRIVNWGRDLRQAADYVLMNEMEAAEVWRREWSKPPPRPKRI
jgi:REP element-mobilizing transposase RayT